MSLNIYEIEIYFTCLVEVLNDVYLQVYLSSLSKLYTKEVADFMDSAKQKLVTTKDSKKHGK